MQPTTDEPVRMPIDHPHANRRNDVAPEDEIEPPKTYESIALDGAVIESMIWL